MIGDDPRSMLNPQTLTPGAGSQRSAPNYFSISGGLPPGTPDPTSYSPGIYIGVPNDWKVYSGDVGGASDALFQPNSGYGPSGTPLVNAQPTYRYPQYTYDMRERLRGSDKDTAQAWQRALMDAGYLAAGHYTGTFDEATADAAGQAMADANRAGKTLNQLFMDTAASQAEWTAAHPKPGPKAPRVSPARDLTSSSVTLTGRAGAQAVLTNALAQQLGREPTPGEVTRFMHSLNAEERANPSVTRTHIAAGGNSQTSTSTQSDVDPSGSADIFAKTNKATQGERQAYRDSNYFDVINQMLGSGG